jgi:hypothetical protein
MRPVTADVTTANQGSGATGLPSSPAVSITCQRCGTVTPWSPYCPTDGAYLEIFGTPPWHPGGPPQSESAGVEGAGMPAGAEVDMDGDGTPDDLPPIKAEAAGPTHPMKDAIAAAQKEAETRALAAAPDPGSATDATATATTVDTPPPAPPAKVTPQVLPSLADRQIRRDLPWGLRWTRHCNDGCCDPRPHVWQVRRSVCCWASKRWPLPPLPEIIAVPEEDYVAPSAAMYVPGFEPIAELPQRVTPPVRATVAIGADGESSGTLECPRCHAMNEEAMAFCRECGSVLPGAILAPNQEPVPEPGRDPNRQRGSKKAKDPKAPPRKHDYVAWAVTASVILIIAAVVFAIWGPYSDTIARYIRLGYQNVIEFVNPYEGATIQVVDVTASSSLPGVVPGALIDGQSTVFWASAPSKSFGTGSVLTFTFASASDIDRIIVSPGIQNGQLSMNALATPAKIRLTFDSGHYAEFNVDPVEPSSANRQVFRFSSQSTTKVILTIEAVYPPEFAMANQGTSGEVALSEVSFLHTPDGNPISQGSLIQGPGSAVTKAIPSGMASDVPSSVASDVPSSMASDVKGATSSASTSASPQASASSSPSASAKK